MSNRLLEEVEYKIEQTGFGVWRRYGYENGTSFHEFRSHRMICGLLGIAVLLIGFTAAAEQKGAVVKPQPLSEPNGNWIIQSEYSDEFNGEKLDTDRWDDDVGDWGVWSWEPENTYVQDGRLHIRMQYKEHIRNKKKLYYTSVIIRSKTKPIRYGYFEAKIKGAKRVPGVCPAFWVYKRQEDKWTEIDFLELTQAYNYQDNYKNLRKIFFNTHVFYHPKLKQEKRLRESRIWDATWDPTVDFHVYGCEWNEKEIRWFVDGKVVQLRKNDFWDQPLDVVISMGVRRPLKTEPCEKGFPTEMFIDYVRVWKKQASVPEMVR